MRACFWMRAALVGGFGLLVAFSASLAPARAIGITAEITALGGDSYRAVYAVHNDGSLGAGVSVLLFDLLFDPTDALESSLSIVSPASVSSGWSELLLASAPSVPAAYDALALGAGIADGGTVSGFAVEFQWLGAGAPGSQAFAIYDASSFALLESGATTVPEPPLLGYLAVLGAVGLLARSGRARRRSRFALALAFLALATAPRSASATVVGADDIEIANYALVSSLRVSRTEFEYTYAADVANWQDQAIEITASLSSTSPHTVVVEGALEFGSVPAGATRHSVDTFTIRLDRQVPFDPDALVWTVGTAPVPPTSCALIDAALAAGTIDDETALAYKVFADFGDPRLPADLQGDDGAAREGCGAQEALERFSSLSVATQDLLAPFLVRPEDPASWLRTQSASLLQAAAALAPALPSKKKRKKAKQASRGASSILATATPAADPLDDVLGRVLTRNGKVYVHWRKDLHPDDDGVAQVIADEIDDTIWTKLTGLLGEPKPDEDGVLDVYLIDTQALTVMLSDHANDTQGLTRLRAGSCDKGGNAAVVYLNRDKLAELPQTAAHEITHAIQARFSLASNCEETRWLREASATWAEHFVYPRNDTEHGYASSFLGVPEVPLEKLGGLHEYGAYLWFLYATRNADANAPSEVRSVWDFLAGHDSLGALDAVSRITTGNGLRERWHEFALYNWNRVIEKNLVNLAPPATTRYVGKPYLYYGSWDGVADAARESTGPKPLLVDLGGSVSKTYRLSHRIRHLAAKYFHYDFRGDPTIRRLRFTHPYANGSEPAVKVQALVKLRGNGGWKEVADWTRDEKHFLCRDKPEEDFEQLIIVISDGEFSNREHVVEDLDGDNTQLKVSALGCRESYVGSVQLEVHDTTPTSSRTETATADKVTLTIVLPLADVDDDGLDSQSYNVTAGTVAWTHEGFVGEPGFQCHGKSSGSFSAVPAAPPTFPTLTLGVLLRPVYFMLALQEDAPNPDDYTCPTGGPLSAPIPDYPVWLASPNPFTGSGVLDLPAIGDSGEGTLAGSNIVRTTSGDGSAKTNSWSWFFAGSGTFD